MRRWSFPGSAVGSCVSTEHRRARSSCPGSVTKGASEGPSGKWGWASRSTGAPPRNRPEAYGSGICRAQAESGTYGGLMFVGYHRSHEASVAVFDDGGRPLFAASEERFSRVKMQGGWPRLTAEVVEREFDLGGALAYHGGLPFERRLLREARLGWWNWTHGRLQDVHPKRLRKLVDVGFGRTRQSERALFASLEKRHVDHHTCHAASAYYQSGCDEAEVVTCDGRSEEHTSE